MDLKFFIESHKNLWFVIILRFRQDTLINQVLLKVFLKFISQASYICRKSITTKNYKMYTKKISSLKYI